MPVRAIMGINPFFDRKLETGDQKSFFSACRFVQSFFFVALDLLVHLFLYYSEQSVYGFCTLLEHALTVQVLALILFLSTHSHPIPLSPCLMLSFLYVCSPFFFLSIASNPIPVFFSLWYELIARKPVSSTRHRRHRHAASHFFIFPGMITGIHVYMDRAENSHFIWCASNWQLWKYYTFLQLSACFPVVMDKIQTKCKEVLFYFVSQAVLDGLSHACCILHAPCSLNPWLCHASHNKTGLSYKIVEARFFFSRRPPLLASLLFFFLVPSKSHSLSHSAFRRECMYNPSFFRSLSFTVIQSNECLSGWLAGWLFIPCTWPCSCSCPHLCPCTLCFVFHSTQ